MNAYLDAWRRCFDFSSRSTRSQFWLFHLFMLIFGMTGVFMDALFGNTEETLYVTGLIVVPHYLPALAVFVRRMHDIDRTGWWFLITFIPVIGQIMLLVFVCTPSTPGRNRFGPSLAEGLHNRPYEPVDSRQMASSASHLEQLEKLVALRSSGAIDDTEFDRMKAALLAREGA